MSASPELPELEMAFAKDPTSSAFIPLTQAYLQQGRFMEAMVVCRKGIKAQPDNVVGRLLLARVYAEQGKLPKAIEEVKGVLSTNPSEADAHAAHGQLLDKSGKSQEAIDAFKEALSHRRDHAEAIAGLKAKGIEWNPGPSPEEIEAARRAEEERRAQIALEEQQAQQAAARAQQARARATAASMSAVGGNSGASSAPVSRRNPSVPPGPVDPSMQGYAGAYGFVSGPVPVAAQRRFGPGFTFGLGALLLLVVVGFIFALRANKEKQEEIAQHVKAAQKSVAHDTTRGHREALKELEAALKLDDGQTTANGLYALSLVTLSLQRGDKEFEAKAREATASAVKHAPTNPNVVAAQMAVLRADAKLDDAVAVAEKLRGNSDVNTLPFPVRVELGRAYASLARIPDLIKLADGLRDTPDPAVLTFVAEAYRRVGDRARARAALDGVMKVELDHDAGRALRALLILEADDVTNLAVAIDDLSTLRELGKDNVGVRQRGYASLGLALISKKLGRDDKESERDLASARTQLRNDPEIALFDAKQAIAAKDFPKAQTAAAEAIKLDRVRLEPYLTLADAASRAKDWPAADKALNDAQAIFGDNNLELGLARAERLRDEDKNDAAVDVLRAMLTKLDVAEVHRDIGKVLLNKRDIPGAVAALQKAGEKAVGRSPSVQANVYMWLGRAYAAAGDHQNAVTIYAQALNASAEYAAAYFFLGMSELELKDNEKAKQAFKKYLAADPNGVYRDRATAALSDL